MTLSFRFGLVAFVGLSLSVASTFAAEPTVNAQRKLSMEKVAYKGWANNLKISNGEAELIVTLDIGPRVISYRLNDGENVFKNYAEQMGRTGESEWQIRGGHRVWAGPEDKTRTYALDNSPVTSREIAPGVIRFAPGPDTEYSMQRELDLALAPTGSKVKATHRITNIGKEPIELCVWGISVMAPGGTEIIPLPPKAPHPGSPKNARSAADFAPNQLFSIWSYLDFSDTRWHWGSKYITLKQDSKKSPTKLGIAHRLGKIGYLNNGTLFVSSFDYIEGKTYPDAGVNFETFTNEDMLEIESLGPVLTLKPGETAEHVEHWELFGGIGEVKDEAEIDAKIGPKLK